MNDRKKPDKDKIRLLFDRICIRAAWNESYETQLVFKNFYYTQHYDNYVKGHNENADKLTLNN